MVRKKPKNPIKFKKKDIPQFKKEEFSESESEKIKKTKIRVIGIGGGGGNIVSELISRVEKATFAAVNTDRQDLKEVSQKAIKFQFGENFTHGLGTGMDFELAEQVAIGEKEKIKNLLKGQDLVILIATLGGGVGSGASPIFAKISKSLGNLTYGIFTLPFKFEGERKIEIARESLERLKFYLNGMSIIPNDFIFKIIDRDTPLTKGFSIINKNLADNIEGLIETIYQPGLINIDFADFKTIFNGKGKLTYLKTIEIEKEKGIEEIIKKLNFDPLYPYTIKGAKGVLFNISGGKDLSLSDVSKISKNIFESVNKEAKIIFGVSQNQKETNKIKICLLANGCQAKIFPSKPKKTRTKEKKYSKSPKIEKKKKTSEPKKNIKKEIKNTQKPVNPLPLPEEKVEIKVRRNALEIKEEVKEAEKEIIEKEKIWETPAFLRKKKI